MPIKVEHALKAEAAKKHLTGDRKAAYVYGTLARIRRKQAMKGKS